MHSVIAMLIGFLFGVVATAIFLRNAINEYEAAFTLLEAKYLELKRKL